MASDLPIRLRQVGDGQCHKSQKRLILTSTQTCCARDIETALLPSKVDSLVRGGGRLSVTV